MTPVIGRSRSKTTIAIRGLVVARIGCGGWPAQGEPWRSHPPPWGRAIWEAAVHRPHLFAHPRAAVHGPESLSLSVVAQGVAALLGMMLLIGGLSALATWGLVRLVTAFVT